MEKNYNPEIYAAMQAGKPFKSYIKTMLGKIYVVVLDPFSGDPDGIILQGNPKNKTKNDSCIIDTWDEVQDLFFRRINKRQFELGNIIPYVRPEPTVPTETPITELSDEELVTKFLNQKYYSFSSLVNKIEQAAVLVRLLDLARENEKSEKMINFLESKLSELQGKSVFSKE